MLDLLTVDDSDMNQTMRLIKKEVARRKWKASVPRPWSLYVFLTRDDGVNLTIFGATPPTTSYAAAKVADDKIVTYELLNQTDIPQLDTISIREDATNTALTLMKKFGKIVVKPIDGSHGNGVSVGIHDEAGLRRAIAHAKAHTTRNTVLVQRHFPYDTVYDLRMLCIDYRFIAAIYRMPAIVIGDGVHTTEQLIAMANADGSRGVAYKAPLAMIDVEGARRHLSTALQDVPPKDQRVEVLGIANYGAGGETIDATDSIPDWLKRMAELASRTLQLPVAGVDFMLNDVPQSSMTREQLKVAFTEANKGPSLAIHAEPTRGMPRDAVRVYFDYLATID